jgi:hypothetical protein
MRHDGVPQAVLYWNTAIGIQDLGGLPLKLP